MSVSACTAGRMVLNDGPKDLHISWTESAVPVTRQVSIQNLDTCFNWGK